MLNRLIISKIGFFHCLDSDFSNIFLTLANIWIAVYTRSVLWPILRFRRVFRNWNFRCSSKVCKCQGDFWWKFAKGVRDKKASEVTAENSEIGSENIFELAVSEKSKMLRGIYQTTCFESLLVCKTLTIKQLIKNSAVPSFTTRFKPDNSNSEVNGHRSCEGSFTFAFHREKHFNSLSALIDRNSFTSWNSFESSIPTQRFLLMSNNLATKADLVLSN